MARPSDSFKQFDYALRPSKQVERKIMIEVLLTAYPRLGTPSASTTISASGRRTTWTS